MSAADTTHSGCVDITGSLNISVAQPPTAGQNVSFLESPCITYAGSSTVQIGAQTSKDCGVAGEVDKVDARHLGVLFYARECKSSGGLPKAAIAGIVVGIAVLVAVLTTLGVVGARYCLRRRLRPQSRRAWASERIPE